MNLSSLILAWVLNYYVTPAHSKPILILFHLIEKVEIKCDGEFNLLVFRRNLPLPLAAFAPAYDPLLCYTGFCLSICSFFVLHSKGRLIQCPAQEWVPLLFCFRCFTVSLQQPLSDSQCPHLNERNHLPLL